MKETKTKRITYSKGVKEDKLSLTKSSDNEGVPYYVLLKCERPIRNFNKDNC